MSALPEGTFVLGACGPPEPAISSDMCTAARQTKRVACVVAVPHAGFHRPWRLGVCRGTADTVWLCCVYQYRFENTGHHRGRRGERSQTHTHHTARIQLCTGVQRRVCDTQCDHRTRRSRPHHSAGRESVESDPSERGYVGTPSPDRAERPSESLMPVSVCLVTMRCDVAMDVA